MGQPPVGWSASRSVQIQSVYTVYVYVTPFSFVFQWGFVDGWPVGRSVVRHSSDICQAGSTLHIGIKPRKSPFVRHSSDILDSRKRQSKRQSTRQLPPTVTHVLRGIPGRFDSPLSTLYSTLSTLYSTLLAEALKASIQRLFNALLYDGSGGLSLSWSMSRLACLLVCPHPSTGQRKYRTDGKTVVTRIRTQWCIHFGAASVLSRLRRWCPSMSSPIYLNLEKPAFLSCRPFSSFRSQSSICNSRAQVDQQGVTSPTLTACSYAMEHM